MEKITIFKGDDTDFTGNQEIVISIDTDIDITGYTAKFQLLHFKKSFESSEVETKELHIVIGAEDTKKFPLCEQFATLWMFDLNGKIKTLCNKIPVEVTNRTCGVVLTDGEIKIRARMKTDWENISGKPQIDDLPERFTDETMRDKVNELARKVSGRAVMMASAAFLTLASFGGLNVHIARKGDIYNDQQIVTNVTFDGGAGIGTNEVKDIVLPIVGAAAMAATNYTDEAISAIPPVELPTKWALANVTNAQGQAVGADDVGAYRLGNGIELESAVQSVKHRVGELELGCVKRIDLQYETFQDNLSAPSSESYIKSIADSSVSSVTNGLSGRFVSSTNGFAFGKLNVKQGDAPFGSEISLENNDYASAAFSLYSYEIAPGVFTNLTMLSYSYPGIGTRTFIIPYKASVDKHIYTFATTDDLDGYVPWANTNRNAVTVGSRGDGAVGARSLANGYDVVASSTASHAEGLWTEATGPYSHAEGETSVSTGEASHAEGQNTEANGANSHAEGRSTVANGAASHAEGVGTYANGEGSHAEGDSSMTYGAYSVAMGKNARTQDSRGGKNDYAFVWQGGGSDPYYSHGPGTFNLNPVGGISGIWIGERTVDAIIEQRVSQLVSARLNTYIDGETGVEYVGKFYEGSLYYVPTGNVYPPND